MIKKGDPVWQGRLIFCYFSSEPVSPGRFIIPSLSGPGPSFGGVGRGVGAGVGFGDGVGLSLSVISFSFVFLDNLLSS